MSVETEQANAAWARYYVGLGWAIIPIHVLINGWCSCGKRPCGDTGDEGTPGYTQAGKNAGKHPVQSGWTNASAWVRSEAGVARTWGDPRGIPYSIGIVCGSASGVWILDVDPRNGGFESLERLEGEWGASLPETLLATTGSGGKHFFFKVPDGVRLKKGPLHKDYPGLDVQAEGAQSVLAPSTHASGRRYEWATPPHQAVVEAPAALLDMIKGDRGSKGAGLGGAALDISQLMAAGVPDGARNDTVYKVACSFARKLGVASDLELKLVVGAVEAFNRDFVNPPLELDELQKIVGSAVGFIQANPGSGDLPDGVKEWLEAQQRGAPAAVVAPVVPDGVASVSALPTPPAVLGPGASANAAAVGAGGGGGGTGAGGGAGGASSPPGGGGGAGGGSGVPAGGSSAFGPTGLPPDPDSIGPDGQPGNRTETDNGNARRIVDYFPDELRFTAELGWFRWSDITWRPDVKALYVTEKARELAPLVVAELVSIPQGTPQWDNRMKHVNTTRASASIRKAVALAESDPRVQVAMNVWDSDVELLGVMNGVVDLRTGNLVPPARNQYITKRTACAYEPGKRDTRLAIWLDQTTNGDKELQALLQRWAGYCLTAEVREEKFVMLYGPAGTGKSTFLELVKAAAGDYGLTLDANNIMASKFGGGAGGSQEYFIAEIVGKRVIVVSELAEGESMKEDVIKRLTGADSMMGRPIGGSPIQFRSKAKLMVGTNNRPRIKDNAMWRRVLLVPFLHVPQVADKSLKPYLLDPNGGLPAFLSWAVEGAVAWFARGLGSCAIVDEATSDYKASEDEVGIFLAEELRAGEGLQISMSDVHNTWKLWQEDRGIQNPENVGRLLRKLVDRGLDVEGTGRRAMVKNWALQPKSVPTGASMSFSEMVDRAK